MSRCLRLLLALACVPLAAEAEQEPVSARAQYETRSHPCVESDYAYHRNSRFCVGDSEPILWEYGYEGDHAVWKGTSFPLPADATVSDISHFWALDQSTFLIGFWKKGLWGYKDGQARPLESSAQLAGFYGGNALRQFLYLAVESLADGGKAHRLMRVDDQLETTVLWKSRDHDQVSFGGGDGPIYLFIESSETETEVWVLKEGSNWQLETVRHRVALEPDLSKWIEVEPYPSWPAELSSCPSQARSGPWGVVQGERGPRVERPQYQERTADVPFWIRPRWGRQSAIKAKDGYLVGFDKGEWGGSIWWYSDDGVERYEVVPKYNVLGFVDAGSEIVAIEGLAHLTLTGGSVVRLGQDEVGTWRVVGAVDLGMAPGAFLIESDGSILITTRGGLLRYHEEILAEVPTSDNFDLGTTSIVRDGADLLLGMRHLVIRLTPDGDGYQTNWLAPPNCPRLVRKDRNTCECAPFDDEPDLESN